MNRKTQLHSHLVLLIAFFNPLYSMQRPLPAPQQRPLPGMPQPGVAPAIAKPTVALQTQPPIAGYKAAGILPFAFDPQGNAHLLVGLENRSFQNGPVKAYAMDFGGKIDAQDSNNSTYSAAREGAEELDFIYDETPADFQKLLASRKKYGKSFNVHVSGARTYQRILEKIKQDEITKKPALYNNNNNFYIMYFVRFSYRDVNKLFQDRIRQYGTQIPHDWHEKNQLVWLPLNGLINAIKSKRSPTDPLIVQSPQGPITIWPYFASSLEQAYHRGILDNLR